MLILSKTYMKLLELSGKDNEEWIMFYKFKPTELIALYEKWKGDDPMSPCTDFCTYLKTKLPDN